MSWKDRFKKIRNDFDNMVSPSSSGGRGAPSGQGYPYQQQQQQQYQQPPPPQGYYQQPYQQQPYQHQQPQGYNNVQEYYQPQQPPPIPPHPGGFQAPPPVPPHPGQQRDAASGEDQPPPIPPHPRDIYWQPKFQLNTPVSQEWDAKLGNADGWGNQELEHYTAESQNSFHTPDGQLIIRAIANNSAHSQDRRYTSARLVSKQTLSRDRGVLSAVILSPCASGIWPAFWLLPKEPFSWPVDGEIDIAETWNGDQENRSCLHWGHHHEPQKHRVLGTRIPNMRSRPIKYEFAWDQPGGQAGQGRMVWYIDDRPVMKAQVPAGTRPLRDMTVLLNVAMGGSVCDGKIPANGFYDMVVYTMNMSTELEHGGWARFDADWNNPATSTGNTY